jgi:cephalosporin hydroxylase
MIKKIIEKLHPTYKGKFAGTEFEVNNWDLSAFIVRKIIPVVGVHPFPLNELSLMVAAVAGVNPTHIFEWGTHIGKSARIFYETCKFLNIDTEIHSVDLPDDVQHVEHPHSKRGKLVKGKKNIFLHLGDGVNVSLDIYRNLNKEARVLFYLDGDHSYETVSRELFSIISTVKNPHIVLHDTFCQSPESGYNIGPAMAIEDAMKQFSQIKFKRIETKTGLPGMTYLYTI